MTAQPIVMGDIVWYTGNDDRYPPGAYMVSSSPDSDGNFRVTAQHGAAAGAVYRVHADDLERGPNAAAALWAVRAGYGLYVVRANSHRQACRVAWLGGTDDDRKQFTVASEYSAETMEDANVWAEPLDPDGRSMILAEHWG